MDKLADSSLKTDCWICHNNSENNTNLTIVNSEKILKICKSYLNPSIAVDSFENETPVSCCNVCYESAVELILLEKQIERLRKEVSQLSSLFLKNVVDQRNECGSIMVSPLNSTGRTQKSNIVNDLGFEAVEDENIVHSEDEIELKYSYDDETVPKVLSTASKQLVPKQQMLTKNAQDKDKQKTTKTPKTDLVKCLKMPVIRLERLQSCKNRKPKIVVDKTTVLSENQEKTMSTNALPLSASVVAGENTVKCEKDIEENKPYKCSICGQGFFQLCDLEDHEKLHNNLPHYSCSICDKSFLHPSRLKLHEKLHTAKRPINSSLSSKSVTSSRNLIANKKYSCGDTPFKCSVVSKSFRSSNNSKSDPNIHTGKRTYKCSSCSQSFSTKLNLKNHEMIHHGERLYKCSFCSKSFGIERNLKIHKKIHTEPRTYKCSFCLKSLRSAVGLKLHEAVHTGETPHKCDFCPKSFGLLYLLKRHEIIHTGERPFKCSICGSTFKLNQHLKSHREHKHGNAMEEFILPRNHPVQIRLNHRQLIPLYQ